MIGQILKKQGRTTVALALALSGALLLWMPARAADPAKPGNSQICIPSNYIVDTPVIDAHTILVRMTPGRGYKRIDLADDCAPLIQGQSVAFRPAARVCVQDGLTAHHEDGVACIISRIVTIDADEAQALMLRRQD